MGRIAGSMLDLFNVLEVERELTEERVEKIE